MFYGGTLDVAGFQASLLDLHFAIP